MNSEDVFQLVRSGSLFAAMAPQTARDFHILRRRLLVDCPNTYQELNIQQDGSSVGGQDMNRLANAIMDAVTTPRVDHRDWVDNDGHEASNVLIRSEEDPFYFRGCAMFVVPRRVDYRFHDLAMETPTKPNLLGVDDPTALSTVTGLTLNSIALLKHSLTASVRHRCSIQVLSLPSLSAASPQRQLLATSGDSPVSPSKANATDYFERQKCFTPHCSFGILCPDLPDEPQINKEIPHRASCTSRRWLAIQWSDGTSVPSLGMIAGISTTGAVKLERLKNNNQTIKVGDVLSVETRPAEDAVVFMYNGIEAGRFTISSTMPVAKRLEACYFAVRLSQGAAVATF